MFSSNYGSILHHFDIFNFGKYCELESRFRGRSRSSKLVPFDSLPMVSFYRPIVCNFCLLKCTVFEILTFKKHRDLETRVRGHSQ